MKTSKILKKPVLLILAAVLMIAVIISAVTIVIAATTAGVSEPTCTVTTAGGVNLKFRYDSKGEATKFVAYVGGKEMYVYDVSAYEDGSPVMITVPLKPQDMGNDVEVVPYKQDVACTDTYTYNVCDYLSEILSDPTKSSTYDFIIAYANMGAYAQKVFDGETDPDKLIVDGFFGQGTDPAIAGLSAQVTSTPSPASTYGEGFSNGSVALGYSDGDVFLKFSVAYAGTDAELDANGETVTVVGGKAVAYVRGLNVGNFDTVYAVTFTDAAGNTSVLNGSVLNYLKWAVTSAANNNEKLFASSVLQYYMLATGNTPRACSHMSTDPTPSEDYYWVMNPSGGYDFKCSTCFNTLSPSPVEDAATFYFPGTILKNADVTEGLSATVVTSSKNPTYLSFKGFENAGAGAGIKAFANTGNELTGQYIVLKVRTTGATNAGFMEIAANVNGVASTHQIKLTDSTDWHTIVVDVTKTMTDYTKVRPDANGQYTITDIELRPFGNKVGASFSTFDVSYIALFDDLAELGKVVKEATYEYPLSKTVSATRNTDGTDRACTHSSYMIVNTLGEYTSDDDHDVVREYTCKDCAYVSKGNPVHISTNKYFDGRDLAIGANNEGYQMRYELIDGYLYRAIGTAKGSGVGQHLWRRNDSSGGSLMTSDISVGAAEYLVIKTRANIPDFSLTFSTTGKNADVGGNARTNITIKTAANEEWGIYVIPVKELIPTYYVEDPEKPGEYILDVFYLNMNASSTSNYIDIEYIAFVEDWDEVGAFVKDPVVDLLTDVSGNTTPHTGDPNADGVHACSFVDGVYTCYICGFTPSCNGTHFSDNKDGTHATTECTYCGTAANDSAPHNYIGDGGKVVGDNTVYTYACGGCNNKAKEQVVPNSVNLYIPGEDLVVGTDGTFVRTVGDEGYYYHATTKKTTETHCQDIWLREQYGNYTAPTMTFGKLIDAGTAEYMIVRMRTSRDNAQNGAFSFNMGTTAYNNLAAESYGKISADAVMKTTAEDTWQVFVVNLDALGEKCKADDDGNRIFDTFFLNMTNFFTGHYVDINYIAFVDNWDEVNALVSATDANVIAVNGNNTGTHTSNYNKAEIKVGDHTYSADAEYKCIYCSYDPNCGGVHTVTDNGDGTHSSAACAECGFPASDKEAHTTEYTYYIDKTSDADNDLYQYKCKVCDGVVIEKKVPKTVNAYLRGAALAGAGPYQLTVSADNHGYHAVGTKADANSAGQHFWLCESYKGTSGGYSRIKDKLSYIYELTETVPNGTYKTSTNYTEGKEVKYTVLDIAKAEYMVVRMKTNIKTRGVGIALSSNAYHDQEQGNNNQATSVTLKAANATYGSDWTTYVININKVYNSANKCPANTDGTRLIDTIYLDLKYDSNTETVDIDYVAFVDNWAEVAALVGTGENVREVTTTDGQTVEKNSDGTCKDGCVNNNCDTKCDVCGVNNNMNPNGSHTINCKGECTVCGEKDLTPADHVNANCGDTICDVCSQDCNFSAPHGTCTEAKAAGTGEDADYTIYTYTCSSCKKVVPEFTKKVHKDVNAYLSADNLVAVNASKNTQTAVYGTASLVDSYYHVVATATPVQHIWLREPYNGGNKDSGVLEPTKATCVSTGYTATYGQGGNYTAESTEVTFKAIDIDTAKYMVIRIRTDIATIPICIGTSEYHTLTGTGTSMGSLVNFKPLSKTWTTLIVDLDTLGEKVAANPITGKRLIDTLFPSIPSSVEQYVDIDYIAFVDAGEVSLVAGDETIYNYDGTAHECTDTATADNKCDVCGKTMPTT